ADAYRRAVGVFPPAEAVCAAAPSGGQRVGVVHPTNAAGHATHSYHHPTDEADANRRAVGVFSGRRSGVRRGSLRWTTRRRCPPYELRTIWQKVSPPQKTGNLLHREPPIGQEASLAGTFLLVTRPFAEALAPDLLQPFAPVLPALAQRLLDGLARQATLGQLLPDAQRAVPGAGTAGNVAFQVAGFAEQPFFGQAIQGDFDQLGGRAATAQLAFQLDATMLALREQVHGGPSHGDGRIQHGGHDSTDQRSSISARFSSSALAFRLPGVTSS